VEDEAPSVDDPGAWTENASTVNVSAWTVSICAWIVRWFFYIYSFKVNGIAMLVSADSHVYVICKHFDIAKTREV